MEGGSGWDGKVCRGWRKGWYWVWWRGKVSRGDGSSIVVNFNWKKGRKCGSGNVRKGRGGVGGRGAEMEGKGKMLLIARPAKVEGGEILWICTSLPWPPTDQCPLPLSTNRQSTDPIIRQDPPLPPLYVCLSKGREIERRQDVSSPPCRKIIGTPTTSSQ